MKNFSVSFENINELINPNNSLPSDSKNMLIQVFCADTNEETLLNIQEFFTKYFPTSIIMGTTTDGIVENTNIYNDTKSVATFTTFEKSSIKCAIVKNDEYNNDSYEVGKTIARKLLSENTKLIISFTDGTNTNGEEYVSGVEEIAPEVVLSGGMSADNGKLVKTYVFNKYEIISSGAVAIAVDSTSLNVSTDYAFDWFPVGKKLKVTKSTKNRVYEIDGISAVDIYAKYFGDELVKKLPHAGIEFPLIFQKDGVNVGRAVIFKHEDNSLTFAGNVPEGTEVRFGVGNAEKILQHTKNNINGLLDSLQYVPEAVFTYSCMARRRFMNGNIIDELELLKKLGNTSGFFTYGEFFHSGDRNKLLNETMTLLVLSENDVELLNKPTNMPSSASNYTLRAEHVIANLANVVSDELADLNKNLEQRIQKSTEHIYRQAYFDKLTGLPNRQSLIDNIEDSSEKVLLLINIDDFTTINDFYGYKVGDLVLSRLSIILKELLNDEDVTLYKLASDEFAIVMNKFETVGQRDKTIKKYLSFIDENDFIIDHNDIHVSVTIAVSNIKENNNALANADMTLKLAKKNNKSFMVYSDNLDLSKKSESNLETVNFIKTALSEDGIVPYFQPLLNLKTDKIDKYEALVRLKKKDGEVLSPFAFLEISEKVKLYPYITNIMIEKTFSYFKNNGLSFSINLSFDDIVDKKRMNYLFSMISEYDIAKQLTIEILETQENSDKEAIINFTKKIYAVGAKIAIDDFGSGYANFEHMTTIQSTYMKIDGSLIKNIDKDENAKLVVETIISFAKKLNKLIVAEFVYSKEVYDIVKDMGVDYVQGYYIGKPLDHTL